MSGIMNALRPFLSRIIGTAVGTLAAWLAVHYGVNVDTDTQAQIVEALVLLVIPVFSIVRAVVHRLIDKSLNPADTASSHLATAGKAESKAMKAVRDG